MFTLIFNEYVAIYFYFANFCLFKELCTFMWYFLYAEHTHTVQYNSSLIHSRAFLHIIKKRINIFFREKQKLYARSLQKKKSFLWDFSCAFCIVVDFVFYFIFIITRQEKTTSQYLMNSIEKKPKQHPHIIIITCCFNEIKREKNYNFSPRLNYLYNSLLVLVFFVFFNWLAL